MIYQLIQRILFTILSLVLLAGMVPVSAQEQARYAYFLDTAGKFIKVEISTDHVVAHGSLTEVEGLKKLLPSWREGCATCRVRYDPNRNRLYILTSLEIPSSDKTMALRVLAVELPGFKLLGKVDIGEAKLGDVGILVTPDGSRLLVSYQVVSDDDKHWVFVKEIYDTKKLERVEIKRDRVARDPFDPQALVKARFGEKARFAADGKIILDEEYEIVDGQVRRRWLPPDPEEVVRYLKEHPKFFIERLDEAGRRILLWELIANENFAGRYRNRYATGRFALYNALASKKLREFSIKELEGDYPQIVAITPDGQMMYFAKSVDELHAEFYAVDLMKEATPVRLQLFGLDAYHAQCFFADR